MNGKHIAATILTSVMVFTSATVLADGDWYIGASLGSARVNGISTAKYDAMLANSQGLTASSTLKEDDMGFKLVYGHQFNKNFAMEGSYSDLGKPVEFSSTVTAPLSSAGTRTETVRIRGWGLDAVGLVPVNKELSLMGKAGLYYSRAQVSITGPGAYLDTESETNPKFGLGVNFSLSPEMGVRAEWERHLKIGRKQTTGEGDADLWSAGMIFKF